MIPGGKGFNLTPQVKKEKEGGKNILWLNAGDFYQGITSACTKIIIKSYKVIYISKGISINSAQICVIIRNSVVLTLQVEGCIKVSCHFFRQELI